MRKLRFSPDADVAVLKLSDTYDVTQRRLFEEQHGRPITPDPRPIPRRNDGHVVEVIEEDWSEPYAWLYGDPMVRVQSSRTGDVFLVYMDEIQSTEPDEQ
jgi:hypothetical protein